MYLICPSLQLHSYICVMIFDSYSGNGWGGEVINHLTRARREAASARQSFDEVLEHHTKLEMQLEELEAIRAQEKRAAEAQKEALEAQKEALEAHGQKLAAKKEALTTEKKAIKADLEAHTAEKAAVEVELEGTKVRAEGEIERLKSEAVKAWGLGKEEFLKSSEFDDLCAKKSLAYFACGFKSCVAQFRANGYPEEEHPTPFLSVAQALEDLPDDEEADDGASGGEATPPDSPSEPSR
ncbi:hypothetical protein F511_26124 [Dorcoceras hygrometricum]|uniref:Uncharacterized protein n=1 Tax=Dorcoceras hygrometricum TaxID=472368 RepID=A0A2Z7D6X1_9LAMI|nr:hypothetical protein F511_26124 [Dorcoceras hygrometricum]